MCKLRDHTDGSQRTGIDGAVLAIGLTYEVRSLVEKITSYAAASGPAARLSTRCKTGTMISGSLGPNTRSIPGP